MSTIEARNVGNNNAVEEESLLLRDTAPISPTKKPATSDSGINLKWVALVALVIQNSGLAIVMRLTFLLANATNDKYIPSTAVLNAEILKLLISIAACYFVDSDKNFRKFTQILYTEMYINYPDFLKLMVPSMLYTLQNSLQYFSMQRLSAPVFQVLYQMKIITTAIFSVLLLSKRLSSIQWASIVALTVGVALVQLSQINDGGSKSSSIAGLISVIMGCMTSGFAGVYFEMVLKSTQASIWLRNIQLSLIGIVMSLVILSISFKLSHFHFME
jgi:drug/metabolite transporter (DMT)-like permease